MGEPNDDTGESSIVPDLPEIDDDDEYDEEEDQDELDLDGDEDDE